MLGIHVFEKNNILFILRQVQKKWKNLKKKKSLEKNILKTICFSYLGPNRVGRSVNLKIKYVWPQAYKKNGIKKDNGEH